ncbi:unnamed protein product [Didymodactylos carnosus]|uniref:Uncharacterized protein n=1 Tax=Didymodactylos carnosus TaxID=1234261 RepID=A0A815C094_9BILA|nr:unnamed protein product [Didymodactylos carnosus]CAF1277044.1 unnamed protein product [Didymodactylos carnosus]CAF3870002.1 unnamed protein product [Didymodactylos carnosus]CAF4069313.1 unnamed protein product [Didymodactylos carnosus]
MYTIYPDWILRVYHDSIINLSVICPVECAHFNVDFCDISLLNIDYVPPKIWRFLPAGDELVDIMGSRDLDSALTKRELDAVHEWLMSNKSFHAMRDHPLHSVPMLGGMWGFRPSINRSFSKEFLNKIRNKGLIRRYDKRGDQTFLSDQIWPHIHNDVIAHDSFLCQTWYGKNSRPYPTRRQPVNETNCFIGGVRGCCGSNGAPFQECPQACRPKEHLEWIYC